MDWAMDYALELEHQRQDEELKTAKPVFKENVVLRPMSRGTRANNTRWARMNERHRIRRQLNTYT